MRFTDGLWRKRQGFDFRGGVELAEVLKKNEDPSKGEVGVEYLVACRHVENRGQSMDGPLLTFNVSSVADDIIKVRIDHFKGVVNNGPHFQLFPDGPPPPSKSALSETDSTLNLTSGTLNASINKSPHSYSLSFNTTTTSSNSPTDTFLCATEPKGSAIIDVPTSALISQFSESSITETEHDAVSHLGERSYGESRRGKVRFVLNELSLSVGETIYGLGERFGPFVKNGGAYSIWNQDGGTSSQQSYKNIPFYLSSRGYGIFVNDPTDVEFEVGAEKCSKVGFSVRGEGLEYYVIGGGGRGMKGVLERFCELTGKPALPPSWTFGLYMSTSFTTSYDEKTVSGFLEGMKERNCHTRVLHLDCYWMKAYDWCSFEFDKDAFPNPGEYLKTVKEKYDLKVCVWINPYISQRSRIFPEGVEKGYFIKRDNGDVFQWDHWQPGMAYVDFTNPAARTWYASQLEGLMDLGVDSFKTDFGERIPHLGVKYFDGSDARRMHNYYTEIYNNLVFTTLEKRLGKDQAAVFARSATAGGQRYPVHWGGDCESTYEAMAESLRGGLSLTSSGFSYWSHDIGGFEGLPPAAVFKRWVAFGLFSSHSRLHGSKSYRVPWLYDIEGDDEASRTLATMVKAKLRLMPYLYAEAIKSHQTGVPMMRSMVLEYPDDPTCQYLDKQYMLGGSLLVAPVFHDSIAQFYLPEGRWTCFWTNETLTGPRWHTIPSYPFTRIPCYVRENTVLLLGPEDVTVPDYEYAEVGLEVRKYEIEVGEGEVVVDVPSGRGAEWAGRVVVRGGEVRGEGVKLL